MEVEHFYGISLEGISMSFQEFIMALGFEREITFWGLLIFLMSIGIEVIPKVKWSPWTAFIKWIGSRFNSQIDTKMDEVRSEIKALDTKIDTVQEELARHITEAEIKSLQDTRRDILQFCNSCLNGQKHTKEQFDFVITQCDAYEKYIKKTDAPNGVIEAAIKEIRRLYQICIQEHSFLKEGENK